MHVSARDGGGGEEFGQNGEIGCWNDSRRIRKSLERSRIFMGRSGFRDVDASMAVNAKKLVSQSADVGEVREAARRDGRLLLRRGVRR